MITEIKSKDNKTYKAFTKLLNKKYRDQEGLFLIEECNLVQEAFDTKVTIRALIVKRGCENNIPDNIAAHLEDVHVYILEEPLYNKLCSSVSSRGVMAEVEKQQWDVDDFSGKGRTAGLVVLDRLQDPGNVGTIIRTADGAGVAGIICVKGTCDVYSPKTLRSSVGSIFRVPIVFVDSAQQAIDLCHSLGAQVAVSCFEGACDYRQASLGKDCAIVVGNEGQGVSDVFLDKADIRVKIPMFGSLESLNASVAASLLMYEAARRSW